MKSLFQLLEDSAAESRAARVAAATETPKAWAPMETAPKDGSLLDVLFEVATAEPGMAEFYAPGCTRKSKPAPPVIENVAFVNNSFKPVINADGAIGVAALKGGFGNDVDYVSYGIISVTLTHWRPAAFPHID